MISSNQRTTNVMQAIMFMFVLNIVFFAHLPGMITVGYRVIAPAYMIIVLLMYNYRLLQLPAEFYAFLLFLVWSFSTVFMLRNPTSLTISYSQLLPQILILMIGVFLPFSARPRMNLIFIFFIVYAFLFVVASNIIEPIAAVDAASERYYGNSPNPNGLAFVMLMGLFGTMFFHDRSRNIFVKLSMIASSGVFVWILILSASRKTVLTAAFFLIAWLIFVHGKALRSKPWILPLVIVLLIIAHQGYDYVRNETLVGTRMQQIDEIEEIKENTRYRLYLEGFEMFKEHPITGVGFGRFTVYAGLYAHSEYMEVLASTGIVGIVLYMFIYVMIFYRIRFMWKYAVDNGTRYNARYILAVMLTMVFLGLFRPHLYSPASMLVLTFIISYLYCFQRLVGPVVRANTVLPDRRPKLSLSPVSGVGAVAQSPRSG